MSATPATNLLPGVQPHGSGYRARLSIGGRRHVRTFRTAREANAAILEWQELKDADMHPTQAPARGVTLGDAADRWLQRKIDLPSDRHGRMLAAESVKGARRMSKPWREGKLSRVPLRHLSRDAVRDVIEARATGEDGKPSSAADELRALKAILSDARDRGAQFDDRILALRPVRHVVRKRVGLSASELVFLARHARPEARRMLELYGTTGCRFGELATLTDDRVNLDEGWIYIPAELCKERRAKFVDLTPREIELLREQLDPTKLRAITTSPTSRLPGRKLTPGGHVFTSVHGKPVSHETWTRYFQEACTAAADGWRKIHDVTATPFDDVKPHDLRSTAATLMRDAGMTREDAAARLGHADAGLLLSEIYDQGSRRERARLALRAKVGAGLLTDPTAVTTPDDAAGSAPGV